MPLADLKGIFSQSNKSATYVRCNYPSTCTNGLAAFFTHDSALNQRYRIAEREAAIHKIKICRERRRRPAEE
jgi:hypothetical protein